MELEAQDVPYERQSEAVEQYADRLIAAGQIWRDEAGSSPHR
jgi:hypothetical protein